MNLKKIHHSISLFSKRIPVPAWFLLIGILAYGLLIPNLGFYLDDWYIVLHQKYYGAGTFIEFFRGDRPFFAFVYDVFVPVFKDSRIAWQVFALLTHVLSAVVFWYLLEILIPKQKRFNFIAGLFFLVYPGFKFHWFAVMYSQVFFLYAVYFLSFILMVFSVTAQKWKFWYTAGALVCLVVGIVPQESFLGLEFIRPIVLYVALGRNSEVTRKTRIGSTFLRWLPYLTLFLGFVTYRILNSSSYSYQVSLLDAFKTNAGDTTFTLAIALISGAAEGLVLAWINLFSMFGTNLISSRVLLLIVLILIIAGITYLKVRQWQNEIGKRLFFGIAILIGIFSAVAGMLPFLAGGFEVKLDFPNNRYLIAVAPGAAIFLAGLIEYFLGGERQKNLISAVMVGLAVTMQFTTARTFQLNWDYQKEFFWQLYWRAPAIAENTLLVSEDLPFSRYSSDTSLTAPLNLVYAPQKLSTKIPYAFILFTQSNDVIETFEPGTAIDYQLRAFEFAGNSSNYLLFKKPSIGCLRILTSQDTVDEVFSTYRNNIWRNALEWADEGEIIPNPVEPPASLVKYFGEENTDQWCYFYEKAALAAQQQKWAEVISIYNTGFEQGFTPLNQFEWLPLLKAHILSDSLDKVVETARGIPNFNFEVNDAFCRLWATIEGTKNNMSTIQSLNQITQCE